MSTQVRDVLRALVEIQPTLHAAGTVSAEALAAIAKYTSNREIVYSAETGCGATTILLSHVSQNHTVFSLDVGASVSNVRRSPLLRQEVVTFVPGPSQRTLASHEFRQKLQLALIDGPHAYPFPDLEYYFLYPHLEAGALLIIDDIQIRSVHNLYEFLRQDPMFRLEQVVRTTAFFLRTNAPTFDPLGDNWQEQPYNRGTLLRYDWKSRLNDILPASLARRGEAVRRRLREGKACPTIRIVSPRPGDLVSQYDTIEGTASLQEDVYIWILVHRKDVPGWWPQGGGCVDLADGSWSTRVTYGSPDDAGRKFEIASVIVSRSVHEQWVQWVQSVQETGQYPPVQLPRREGLIAAAYRTVTRR